MDFVVKKEREKNFSNFRIENDIDKTFQVDISNRENYQ